MFLTIVRLWLKLLSQVAAANLRFGDGVTSEVGMDFKNQKATKVRASPCFSVLPQSSEMYLDRRLHRPQRRKAAAAARGASLTLGEVTVPNSG